MLKPLCLSFFVNLLTIPVHAETSESRSLITVSGKAEVRVAPDEAVFRLRVETLDKDLARAKSRNMKAAQEKAAAMAREIGQSIGKAFTITEEAAPSFSSQWNSNTSSRVDELFSDSGGSTIAAGEITVQARVQVSFLLE